MLTDLSLSPSVSVVPKDFKADILFVLDSSQNVGRTNFRYSKEFTKILARVLNLSPTMSRGAVIIFNNKPYEVINFDDHESMGPFSQAVDSVNYLGGSSRLDLALRKAASVFRYSRSNFPKILLLVTNWNGVTDPVSELALRTSVTELRKQNVLLNVLGVGEKADINGLRALTKRPGAELFEPRSFDELLDAISPIARHIVNGKFSERKRGPFSFSVFFSAMC